MKGTKHDIDYFLTNHDFISWVKSPTPNNDFFWKKWLKNHPGDKEAFYNAKAVLQRVDFPISEVSENRKEEILDSILQNKPSQSYLKENYFKKRVIHIRPWLVGSAAAVLLLWVASTFLWNNLEDENSQLSADIITRHSNNGEKLSFYLPDSSLVTLNSESTLSYPSQFNSDSREVSLVGEAYFDVMHNAKLKFLVKSGGIITQVHGTSFNVRAYGNERPINVSLERGSVSVHSGDSLMSGVSFNILPGEKLTVHKDFVQSKKSTFDYEEEFGWKEGILVFKDADLETFIALMERWYGVNINVVGKNDENWEINGRFKHESMLNILKGLEFSRGVVYKVNGQQVTIYLDNNN